MSADTMRSLLLLMLLLMEVVGEPGWSAPFGVFGHSLWKQPVGSEKLAVALHIQDIWIEASEGEPFYGTNERCQSQAFDQVAWGWTWQPLNLDVVVPYNDQTWYSVDGYCRLLSAPANSTSAFYLYSAGQKWAWAMKYLTNDIEHTCPANKTKFVGVYEKERRNKFSYTVPAPPGTTAKFCLLSGAADAGCQPLPLRMDGDQIVVWNATLVSEHPILSNPPLFCSMMAGGCGATLPLYELEDNSFQYSIKHEEIPWRHLGWVWTPDHCQA